MNFNQFINSFIALLVISNPLSALPAVLKVTSNQTLSEKRRTGIVTAFAVFIILLIATWIGKPLLTILGIKLAAFQLAGGIIIFSMAMSMLTAEESPIKQTEEEQKKIVRESGAIVPLAIPIIAGPGSISTIIIRVNAFPGLFNMFILSLACLLVALVMGLLLYFASDVERLLGRSRINIINRLGGLILAAIAAQMFAAGVCGFFPALAR